MTATEYRAADAVNFSSLKHILTSPAHYRAACEDGEKEETDAMAIGTLAHAMILEGKNLLDLYAIKPAGMSFAKADGKAWKAAQTKPILKEENANKIPKAARSVVNNPHAAALLKACQNRETPLFATLRGVECKALLDAHGTDGVEWVIVDLKTTDDASPEAFSRKVASLHYDMQAAFYSQILAQHHQIETRPFWYWIAVEKTEPYTCAVYAADEWLPGGEEKVERALERLKGCREVNLWPHPWQGINQLPKPKWA